MARSGWLGPVLFGMLAAACGAQDPTLFPRVEGLESLEDVVWYTAELRVTEKPRGQSFASLDRYSTFCWKYKYHGYTPPDPAQVRSAGQGLFIAEMREGNPPAWILSFDQAFQLPEDSWISRESLDQTKDEDVTLLIAAAEQPVIEVNHRMASPSAALFGERARISMAHRTIDGIGVAMVRFLDGNWDGYEPSVRLEGSVHRDKEPAMFHLTVCDTPDMALHFLQSDLPAEASLVAEARDDLPERRFLMTGSGARMGAVVDRYYLKIGGDFMRPENQTPDGVAVRYAGWMNGMLGALFPPR